MTRVLWALAYAAACLVELAASWVKEHAALKLKPPPVTPPPAP